MTVLPTTSQLRLHREHVGKLKPNDIAIYMADLDGPLVVNLENELVIGRIDRTDITKHPEALDLSNFGAMERGVSRAHVTLRRYNKDIVAIDLMSTNGTWVNNYRLKPYLPVAFTSGDRLTLAKLSMYIYFG
jgi:pSer/pThr/pTyr-binding forkhead associated (FHA) protein